MEAYRWFPLYKGKWLFSVYWLAVAGSGLRVRAGHLTWKATSSLPTHQHLCCTPVPLALVCKAEHCWCVKWAPGLLCLDVSVVLWFNAGWECLSRGPRTRSSAHLSIPYLFKPTDKLMEALGQWSFCDLGRISQHLVIKLIKRWESRWKSEGSGLWDNLPLRERPLGRVSERC